MTSAPQEALVSSSTAPMPPVVDFTWKSPDGLTLSGCEWPSAKPDSEGAASPIPVLCLPGLSRNTRDFNEIARFLQTCGHRVIALDYRGRGKSDWDPDWRNYALTVEDKDIDAAIAELGLDRFAVLGTSRGGLHALAMGLRYPASRMAAVIFNDIGPHIEMRAIHRIAATLGHHMKCASHEDVAANLEHTLGYQFPAFVKADWLKLAGQLASEQDGHVMMDYDPALAHQLASLDDATPTPDLWPLYEKLTDRPVLVLRGEHSDLLSPETCRRMTDNHPNATAKTIPGQGHAPVLWDGETHKTISDFLKSV
ncbi:MULTISPECIES: alpha/beta fold hydrolase [Stappiaceae]|uniref:alpha/beta fold hydrolase n=1 Tax=Stappiaceae TaxID=2821832 RepID=UPI001447A4C9|nr:MULTISPECIES: alpha/beta hydrolase [Stappiaceae]NKX67525.1 alpha/beta hydrolase [Labrenzia sp. 5N]WJS01245.1 alpha/beta hydrolase [Roseibium aggregatum]